MVLMPECNHPIKHPLAAPWTFYYEPDARSVPRSKRWLDCLTKLPSVAFVEDFWALWATLPRPSILHDSSVYLFRSDRPPSWESWPEGGRWIVTGTELNVDQLWEDLCLAMLGEQLEDAEAVCGGVCSARRLAVWTTRSASASEQHMLYARLQELLNLGAEASLTFKPHKPAPETACTYGQSSSQSARVACVAQGSGLGAGAGTSSS